MKKILLFALGVVAASANAQVVFYGGDADGRDAVNDQHGGSVANSLVFDNFNFAGGTISGLFVNMVDSGAAQNGFASAGYYEIRSGVSQGVAGTTVASGNLAGVTHVASGRSVLGITEYTYSADGLSINLGAGQYWLAFALDRSAVGGGQSFVTTTSGTNGVGTPLHDNKSYLADPANGFTMEAISGDNLEGGGIWDVSQGVKSQAVPEPATMAALGLGVAAMLRRRNKKA